MSIDTKKIQNFVEWLKEKPEYCYSIFDVVKSQNTNKKEYKIVVIPTIDRYTEYQMTKSDVPDLNDDEKKFLKIRCKNIIFALMGKDKLTSKTGEIVLNDLYGINLKHIKSASDLNDNNVKFDFSNIGEVKSYETTEKVDTTNKEAEELIKNRG